MLSKEFVFYNSPCCILLFFCPLADSIMLELEKEEYSLVFWMRFIMTQALWALFFKEWPSQVSLSLFQQ
jgi:hypothetical protein